MAPRNVRAISLFTNCGAGDVGFARAGFTFKVLAEIDERRLAVAKRNLVGAQGVAGDLRITWTEVVSRARSSGRSQAITLLSACPPCQGMSSARGKRGLHADPDAGSRDDRNLLVLPIAKVTQELLPRILVVENVSAFLSRRVREPSSGRAISAAQLLIAQLSDWYYPFPMVTDLSDYGVPQSRKRAFIVFIRQDEPALPELLARGVTPFPRPSHAEDCGGVPVSIAEALRDLALPPLDACSPQRSRDASRELHVVPVWSAERYRLVAAIEPHSGRSAWENSECQGCGSVSVRRNAVRCPSCGEPLLRPITKRGGKDRLIRGFHNSTYRRLPPDRPAQTITTASGRVGGSFTIHPWENRVLSPLECAALQTFPADFDWTDALRDNGHTRLRAMIGEAVPPLFTKKLGRALRSVIAGSYRGLLRADDHRCLRARSMLELDP